MNKLSIVLFSVFILLSACAKKAIPVSTIEREYGLENFDFEYLQAKSKIKYDSEDRSLTSSATIRMKKDSIIWISLTPVFGLEAARGMITRDTVVFIDRVNKDVYRYNYESLSSMVNFEVNYDILQSVLLGNQVFKFSPEDKYSKSTNELKINQLRQRFNVTTLADKNSRKVTNINVKEEPDGNEMFITFTDFNTVENQALPYQALVLIKSKTAGKIENTEVEINHSKVDVGSEAISFPFSVPSKYE